MQLKSIIGSRKSSQRLEWLDYARGIAIILVVYRHAFEGLKNTPGIANYGHNQQSAIYLEVVNILFFSFRMPLFFIVAGLFIGASLAKRGLQSFIATKAQTILYPFFLWGCLQITVQLVMGAYTNGQVSWRNYLYLLYVPREIAQFWYLLALFNVTVLYAAVKWKWYLTPVHQMLVGLLMFAASTLFAQVGIEAGFVTDVLHYYLFVAIGEAIADSVLSGSLNRFFSQQRSFWILLLPFISVQLYFLKTNWDHRSVSPKFLYVEQQLALQYIGIALTGCAFVASLSVQLARRQWAKWLLYTGRHSLYIYVMHVMAFAAVRIVCTKIFHWYNMPLLLLACIVGGILLPVAAYKLIERIGWQWLFVWPMKKHTQKVTHISAPIKVPA